MGDRFIAWKSLQDKNKTPCGLFLHYYWVVFALWTGMGKVEGSNKNGYYYWLNCTYWRGSTFAYAPMFCYYYRSYLKKWLYYCFQYCPQWVAANLLTFTGFLLTVLNFLIFSWFDYGFYGNSAGDSPDDYLPSWAWAFTSVSLFVAYTLGNNSLCLPEHWFPLPVYCTASSAYVLYHQ